MQQYLIDNIWIIIVLVAWTLPWKAYALWKSARRGDKWWFVALLLINTLGILEILYTFVFGKREDDKQPSKLLTE